MIDTAMYSTCLFCNRDLGANEIIEAFPVGRRLAYDAAKGRLWVVCRGCERWNLTPLEERWEAIESAEKLYRETRLRVATDQVGLARLRDGTELVRIGRPLRPEFAAWRYGDQFGRRRTRQLIIAGAGVAALGTAVIGGTLAGVGMFTFGGLITQGARLAIRGNPRTVVARIPIAGRAAIQVRRQDLGDTTLAPGKQGPISLDIRHGDGSLLLDGPEAMRVAALLAPHISRYGGSKKEVQSAVTEIEGSGGPEGYLTALPRLASALTRRDQTPRKGILWNTVVRAPVKRFRLPNTGPVKRNWHEWGLFGLSPVQRLALEMTLHEEAERRALDGELAALERAWKDAEEIAAIADDMFLPESFADKLKGWK